MARRRDDALSAADSAWWHMERPTNQMVITGVLSFEDPLSYPQVQELFRTRFLRYRRFRQRLQRPRWPLGRLRWVDDESFSLENHLHLAQLPPPADRTAMQELVSELMSESLDPARPLWQIHFVPDFQGGCALVARLHHCIADGIALIRVLLTLDDTPGNETATATWWERTHRSRSPAALRGARGLGRTSAKGGRIAAGLSAGGAVAGSLGRLVTMPFDEPTLLQGPLVTRKRAAWSEPLPLEEVKRIGQAASATVHDVLATCAAGAIREYLLEHGQRLDRRGIRAVVPVSLRSAEEENPLGNLFGLVFLSLPVQVADPLARLRAVQTSMTDLKRSAEPVVVFGLLTVFGRILRPFLGLIVAFLGKKATLVMTDVPGPKDAITFCGSRLNGLMAWVPQAGRLGLGVTLLSYAGQLQVGVAADERLIPDPDAVVRSCERALRELQERLLPTPAGAG